MVQQNKFMYLKPMKTKFKILLFLIHNDCRDYACGYMGSNGGYSMESFFRCNTKGLVKILLETRKKHNKITVQLKGHCIFGRGYYEKMY